MKEETTEIHDSDGNLYATVIDIIKPTTMNVPEPSVRWKELTENKESVKEQVSFKGWKEKAGAAMKRVAKKKNAPKHDYGKDAGAEAAKRLRKRDHAKVNFLDPDD